MPSFHVPHVIGTRYPSYTVLDLVSTWRTAWTACSTIILAPAVGRAVVLVFSSQSLQPLLLGMGIDVCANNKADGVEERDPDLIWQERLSECKRDW